MKKITLMLLSLYILNPFVLTQNGDNFDVAKAEENNSVWVGSGTNIYRGYSSTLDVYLKTYEELSSLSIDIYFPSEALTISELYNIVPCVIYDSSIHEDHVSFTYIFDSFPLETNERLFYFWYSAKRDCEIGNYYFDIIINEAFNSSLETVEFESSRFQFSITDRPDEDIKYAYTNASPSSINTSYNDEFTFSYSISSSEPSCGTFVLNYDYELFEFVSFTKGDFFDDAIFDYNANTTGEIYISFVASSRAISFSLFSVTLRTISNVSSSSSISLTSTELYDQNMYLMRYITSPLIVNISYDPAFEEHPSMVTSYSLDTINKQISLDITLGEDSHLGAGDFVLSFNKDLVSYVSYTKNFTPTFFTVNDKEQQLSQGKIKFSILSTTDITEATDVITFVFSYNESSSDQNITFDLSGSGLTDSLTNPIELNVVGVGFIIPATDFILRWSISYLYMEDPSFIGEGTGRCLSDDLYVIAKRELLKLDELSINNFVNNIDGRYTDALARYMAWSRACGDTSPFAGDGIISSQAINNNNDFNMSAVVALIIVISSFSITLICFLKKKRHN